MIRPGLRELQPIWARSTAARHDNQVVTCELIFLAVGSPVPDLTLTRAPSRRRRQSRLLALSPSAGDGGCFPEPAGAGFYLRRSPPLPLASTSAVPLPLPRSCSRCCGSDISLVNPHGLDRVVDLVGLVAVRSSCRASPRLRAAAGGLRRQIWIGKRRARTELNSVRFEFL